MQARICNFEMIVVDILIVVLVVVAITVIITAAAANIVIDAEVREKQKFSVMFAD